MSNKNVITVFVIGLALLLAAFWVGLYVVRQEQPSKPVTATPIVSPQPNSNATAPGSSAVEAQVQGATQSSPDSKFIVQVYSYGTAEKANELAGELRKRIFKSAYVQTPTADDPLYRVRIGPFNDLEQARQVQSQLSGQGYKGVMILPWKQN